MPIETPVAGGGQEYLGVVFDPRETPFILHELAARPADGPFAYVVTPNVDHVIRLHGDARDTLLADAYAAAGWRLCDSRILARLALMAGVALPVTPGSDLTAALIDGVIRPGDRIAIIGADADSVARLAERLPGAILLHHAPPMGMRHKPEAMAAAADFIARAHARFTFLAVGSPQQEYLAHQVLRRGGASGIGLCIGASIDFLTGRAVRAPRWMQRAGLEWLHRLGSEPRRMWRRYLVEGPRIFRIAWAARRRG